MTVILNGAVALLLVTTYGIVFTRRVAAQVRLLAVQALLLALITLLLGLGQGSRHLVVAALLTVGVKGVVLPRFLLQIIRRLGVQREGPMHIGVPASVQIAGALTVTAYYLAHRITVVAESALARVALPVALAMLFIGLFLMVSRRLALLQVAGLLVIENSLFLAALGMTGGMPLVVELGIAFDVLVAGIILGVLAHRIGQTFESLDTEELKLLKH